MAKYNSLLSASFDHIRQQPKLDLPGWLVTSEIRTKRKPIIDIDFDLKPDEIDGIVSKTGKPTIRSLIFEELPGPSNGQDVLAFYKPYSLTRPGDYRGWGIHFRWDSILRLSAELLGEFKKGNTSVTYGQVVNFIVEMVRSHELEHGCAEVVGAIEQSRNPRAIPTYVADWFLPSRARFSEITAMQQEMYGGGMKIKWNKEAFRSALLFWSTLPLPKNYRDWSSVGRIEADEGLIATLGNEVDKDDLLEVRKDVGASGNNKMIRIPTYYWFDENSHLDIPTAYLRVVFDCKKMARFLKRLDGKAPFGRKVEIKDSPDHDFQIASPAVARPIKFACHDWREVPDFVVGQLTEAFGASSKRQFKEFVSREI